MDIKAVLNTIVSALPIVQALISVIDKEGKSNVPEVVALAQKIIPNVTALIDKIELIRDQTEDEHADVWAQVSGDWKAAVSRWNA